MIRNISSAQSSRLTAGIAAAVLLAAAFACSDSSASGVSGITSDTNPPTVSLTKTTSPDSVVAFSVGVKDNLGIKTIHVAVSGGVSKTFDTTFTSANTDVTIPFAIIASASVPRGSPVLVVASAMDGAGNHSKVDSLSLTIGNLPPPEAKITSPLAGAFAVIGKSVVVAVRGMAQTKIKTLGYTASGSVAKADSARFSSPLLTDTTFQDTLPIPATASSGPLVLTPFLVDSLGVRTIGTPVTLIVQTVAQANSVPVVTFGITRRVEVTDTIHVEATDPAGITALGYEIRRPLGGAADAADSIALTGDLTSAIRTFTMRLPYTTFPDTIFVKAFAKNTLGTRAYAKLSSGSDRVDTVIVVAGATRSLPFGGQVADALYHPGKDRLYLTNILKNQIEVFSLADSSFKTPIIVGSRPWGIASRPLDRSGAMTDTLLVANSGGTDISYVYLNAGASGSEVRRYSLPNIIAYTITTVKSTTGSGDFQQRTKYDFTDRPQFLAATCKDAGSGSCGDVILVYTTTPTGGQSTPFASRNGTLRWENLSQRTSHFFFEQAIGQSAGRSDTLEIVRYDGNNPNDSTVLVPYRQKIGSGSDVGFVSVVVDVTKLAFRDTTFTRNSGNFRRAVVGEGGTVVGSRAMMYDVSQGLQTTAVTPSGATVALTTPYYDNGITGAANASDFIANTFQTISGVAINFDGSLAAIRGDSTYVINPLLQLKGILETRPGSGGVDFHPSNVGPGSFPLSSRLAFAASTQPIIEIYDTNCYKLVGTIDIRDPIIGPVRAALRRNGTLMLVGATVHGITIAQLPNTFTTSCP